ncbi:MAG TPA: anhydro-N-acetylmuramic acid kinase [Candidatus Competibacteraceae bacterium]|nr:anhydro-N-acetylmuramic acid kinase [Candidatus Competibacteraceae bacterium]
MELYLGLMSGTSLDAIDAALVDFAGAQPRLLAHHSSPIEPGLRQELLALCQPGSHELDRLGRLDGIMARRFAATALELLALAGIGPGRVHAIGSHGQTVRHAPAAPEPYTVQIGNPSLIAELTGILTVADFRRRDLAAGGQGAPLAPGFHNAFFRRTGETRVVVNIGGIANISILPGDAAQPVSGFDTGPGNTLLDIWAERHLGTPLDRDGTWGGSGQVIPKLLAVLLADPYFTLPAPKSTGREHFHLDWLAAQLAIWGGAIEPRDVQATLAALTVESIAASVRVAASDCRRLLVCGGGVHNRQLMTGLTAALPGVVVESTAAHGIDPDFLEAMGFAWLARETLAGRPGNLPEVTGARGPRVLGGIYPA